MFFFLSQGFNGLTPGPLSHNYLNGKLKAGLSTIAPNHCFSLKFPKKTLKIKIIVRICLYMFSKHSPNAKQRVQDQGNYQYQ